MKNVRPRDVIATTARRRTPEAAVERSIDMTCSTSRPQSPATRSNAAFGRRSRPTSSSPRRNRAHRHRHRVALRTRASPSSNDQETLTWDEIENIVNRDVVRSVMTSRVLSVGPNASVFEAMKLLVENRISAVPVVDEKGVVLGVVSEYDLMARVGKKETTRSVKDDGMFPRVGRCDEFNGNVKQMWNQFHNLQERMYKASGTKVLTAMHETPATCTPDTPLVEATELMLDKNLARLPVVDERGALLGILSRGDIMRRTFHAFLLAQQTTDRDEFAREVQKLDVSDPGINSEMNPSPSVVEFCEAAPDDDECKIFD